MANSAETEEQGRSQLRHFVGCLCSNASGHRGRTCVQPMTMKTAEHAAQAHHKDRGDTVVIARRHAQRCLLASADAAAAAAPVRGGCKQASVKVGGSVAVLTAMISPTALLEWHRLVHVHKLRKHLTCCQEQCCRRGLWKGELGHPGSLSLAPGLEDVLGQAGRRRWPL